MNTPNQIVRHALFAYPSLYSCPLAVYVNLFTSIGHGYDWGQDGNLTNTYPTRHSKVMRYDDLDERREELSARKNMDGLDSLNIRWKLELNADYIKRKFVEENINDILNSDPLLSLFDYRPSRYGFIHQVSLNYARAFTFPDNITLEWAKILNVFLGYWLVCLNQEYGCSGDADYWKKWPQHIIDVRKAIIKAQHKLKPVLYGPDWEAQLEARDKMIKAMIEEIKNKS
jgi:hypothetical protein